MGLSDMTRDDFEYWLAYMDDALERWLGTFDVGIRSKLDFSMPSLDVVERLLLARYQSIADARPPSESTRLDGFVRYVGEVMRRRLGATWDIVLDRPKYAFGGLPILRAKGMRLDECPHSLVTAAIDRRRGDYLRSCAEAHARSVDQVAR